MHMWPHLQQGRSRILAGGGCRSKSGRSDRRELVRRRPYQADSRGWSRCRSSRRQQRAHPNPTKEQFGISRCPPSDHVSIVQSILSNSNLTTTGRTETSTGKNYAVREELRSL